MMWYLGIDMVPVPFGGSGPTLTGLLGGHVDLASIPYAMVKPHVQAGKLRVLVILGKKKIDELPDVPTAVKLGYEAEPLAFAGAAISARVPKDRIEIISKAFDKAMRDPEVLGRLKKAGFVPVYMDHEKFAKHIEDGYAKVEKIKDKLK
jgi:tripartite-type tricarboxylate transporter receptor subunit TctC